MIILLTLGVFVFGCIIGSFLNVVILRWNTGMSIGGRSRCFSCGTTLRWFELIPVVSFVVGRGRCSSCRARISFQYPLVELLTGLVFIAIFWKHFPFLFSGYSVIQLSVISYELLLWSLLLVITIYDLRHKIIPDGLVYAFAALAFLGGAAMIPAAPHPLLFFLAGPLVALPIFLLWFFSKGKWIGLGDAKLMLGFGWLVGIVGGFSVFFLGSIIGAVVGIGLLLIARLQNSAFFHRFPLPLALKNLTIKSEVPFAPFLIVAGFLVFYFNGSVLSLFPTF